MVNNIEFNSHYARKESNADSHLRARARRHAQGLAVDLPPGLVGDPNATPKKCTLLSCSIERIREAEDEGCPRGIAARQIRTSNGATPRHGDSATRARWNRSTIWCRRPAWRCRSARKFACTNDRSSTSACSPVATTGPGDASSKASRRRRRCSGAASRIFGVAAADEANRRVKPFLTLPTGCNGPLRSTISADSYQEPGHWWQREASRATPPVRRCR